MSEPCFDRSPYWGAINREHHKDQACEYQAPLITFTTKEEKLIEGDLYYQNQILCNIWWR